jgi:hypothetical protein
MNSISIEFIYCKRNLESYRILKIIDADIVQNGLLEYLMAAQNKIIKDMLL